MLEAKKRDDYDQRVGAHNLPEKPECKGAGPAKSGPGDRENLLHALRAARANESSLRQRLHRVHDSRGMELLRGLRDHIACLEERLAKNDGQKEKDEMSDLPS